MNIKHIAVISIVGMLLTTLGCNNNSTEMKQQKAKADSLLNEAYRDNQYQRLEMLADREQNPTMTSR